METNECKVLTFLFERKRMLKDKDLSDSMCFSYKPIGVMEGTEYTVGKAKTFVTNKAVSIAIVPKGDEEEKDNTSKFRISISHMTDLYSLEDKYVYGFPLLINSKKTDIDVYIKEMSELIKDLRDFKLVHFVGGGDPLYNKLFLSDSTTSIDLEGNDYYELFDLIYGTMLDDIKEVTTKKEYEQVDRANIVLPSNYIYADDIYNTVNKTVRCQDDAIKKIATAIAKNSRLENPALKSNLLIAGPTGVGKSEIFRVINNKFNIPITFEDSNEYTANGYKGKDVIEMLIHLIDNANGDVDKAQRGILIVDEIDKKVAKSSDHEVFSSAVINSLLKMMEGHVYNVPMGKSEVQFDTSLLTFAFLGAFSGIEEYSNKRSLGFMTREQEEEQNKTTFQYTNDTIGKYGLIPEFMGRCDSLIVMNSLGVDDFVEIIKTSDKSQLLLYKYLLESQGIDFIYDDKTIEAIAKKAVELKLGARSIKKIIENSLAVANYSLFARNNYKKLIISEETIEDNTKFILK